MKKSLAFLLAGATWFLFSGLTGAESSLVPFGFHPSVFSSKPIRINLQKQSSPEIPPSPTLSYLETRWKSERLLQTAA